MKESYSEGVTNHTGLGSSANAREGGDGTLIEVRTGTLSSREIISDRDADGVFGHGRQDEPQRQGERRGGPARSKTLGMYGNTRHGDWEIPALSAAGQQTASKSLRT